MNLWNNTFAPMLLKEVSKPFNDKNYYFILGLSFKWILCCNFKKDGYPSSIATISPSKIQLFFTISFIESNSGNKCVISFKDKNLDQLPLIERKKVLDSFKENDSFLKSRWIEEKGISLYKYVKKVKLEGIVAKKKELWVISL